MGRLLRYLSNYKKECILAPLFKMLEASFELLVPLVMAAMIDNGIAADNRPYIIKLSFVIIGLGLIGLTCSCTAQYFSAKAAIGFGTKVRHTLFAHIQGLSYSEVDAVGTSTLITRLTSDINQTQNGVNMVLRLFLRSPFVVLGAMIMAFTVDVKAALIFVVTIPVLSVVVYGVMALSIPRFKKVQSGLDNVMRRTRDNLAGIRVIRAFALEDKEREHFSEENNKLTTMQMVVGRISALTNPVTYVIINLATVAVIYVGAVRVDTGYLTQGQVVALVNYMSQILVELVKLANLIVTINKALASANRIKDVLEIPGRDESEFVSGRESESVNEFMSGHKKDAKGDKESGQYSDEKIATQDIAVEFKNVSLTYNGSKEEALSDISFIAKKGETIGIIGGTGSGKSSLVNLIPGFYKATKGTVSVDGADVNDIDTNELRGAVGMVPQKAVLFHGSIRENLLWGNENATDAELDEALILSQSKEFVMSKEGGLDYYIEHGGKNLSGGQKQRLTIARALVRKPDILILDDSSSALDYATDKALRNAIKGLSESGDMTVFIVSQRASSVMNADKIIVMDDGQIEAVGTNEELLENSATYREIYNTQFKEVV